MQIISISLFIVTFWINSAYAANIVTYYRDGALLEIDGTAIKGVVTIPVSAGFLANTLTVTPFPGTSILDVEIFRSGVDKNEKLMDELAEKKLQLEDRLQALEKREAIFASAAKTQSGKAPHKTKANPDPMQAIRQGTDFAIAQLEAVYTARRKTTQEIQRLNTRIALARKTSGKTEQSVKININPPRGKVTLRYATADLGWQPEYKLHLEGDSTARLQLYARTTGSLQGYKEMVSAGLLAEAVHSGPFSLKSVKSPINSYILPITEVKANDGVFKHFFGRLTNNSTSDLPPGESSLFRNGSYIGKFRFEGLSSGRSKLIAVGK